MLNFVKQFIEDEEGASAVEYGLLVALMAAAVTAAVGILGPGLSTTFQGVVDSMTSATTPAPAPPTTPTS
ncbi:Flp family type IVb pilin [Candidatus Nitronereus thalassa]|uniref:Flp family type IVb pilin n=1 Tax=Candidatus Nitronereus thalassa TaxID=3020898 RepID=A0ABU3KB95_9BACT|nr:Flp family type IVb pilin [Candidatus Nitronereus thalassa]MDT7043452.1 Flp family type IVb pilin [Candidatus Nitronereus thalassa]